MIDKQGQVNKYRPIEIAEVQAHLLSIAKEFDRVCSEHGIPYYMLGGSMLGAIRHKGFIPWDDDMDFGVPIEYYDELIGYLGKELHYPYRCCTCWNHPAVLYNYIKIEDMQTCIDDPSISLPIDEKLGVNIDIFPLSLCKDRDRHISSIWRKKALMGYIFLDSTKVNYSRFIHLIKRVLRFICGSPTFLQKRIGKELKNIEPGGYRGNILGRWKGKEIIPVEWYGKETRYLFEDITLLGLKEYDSYLSMLYGDYLSLPPVEKQKPHVSHTFSKL
ncbi:MAG: LicD family protein [Bacteroidales bacterium]|nr:LicD family protein [Bacteroidales bacterium]